MLNVGLARGYPMFIISCCLRLCNLLLGVDNRFLGDCRTNFGFHLMVSGFSLTKLRPFNADQG